MITAVKACSFVRKRISRGLCIAPWAHSKGRREPSNLLKIFLDTRRSCYREMWAISLGIRPLISRTECSFVIWDFSRDVDENCALWYITQPVLVIPYRRFGTTYRSQLQGSCDVARTRCTPASILAEDLAPHVERPVCWNIYIAIIASDFSSPYVLAYIIFDLHLACGWNFFPLFRLLLHGVVDQRYFYKTLGDPPTPKNPIFFNTRRISLAVTTNTWLGDPGLGYQADLVVSCARVCG